MSEAKLSVLGEVYDERVRQDEKWGEQNHPAGTNDGAQDIERADAAELIQVAAVAHGLGGAHRPAGAPNGAG